MEVRLCECGCGGVPLRAKRTYTGKIRVGEQYRFLIGHHTRLSPHEYLEEDHGFKTPCWIWQRAVGPEGYGRGSLPGEHRSTTPLAHRMMWERLRGPIPETYVIDHLCAVKRCVNPDHLEPVTQAENILRSRLTEALGTSAQSVVAALQKHPEKRKIIELLSATL